jgi:hypothetical protein
VIVPVQAVPFSEKPAGTGLAPDQEPVNPMLVAAFVASEPFQP